MMEENREGKFKTPDWLPGMLVLAAVLLLLRGPAGTVDALWLQVKTLVGSFLGGPDAVVAIIWHTLPLALAAAVISYAVTAEWLRFDSFGSFVAASGIIFAGSGIGGFLLTEFADKPKPLPSINGPLYGFKSIEEAARAGHISAGVTLIDPPTPYEQLRGVDWLAAPNLDRAPAEIVPVKLLPENGGAIGLIGRAVNHLLGCVVAYNPRLFFASLLAGAYFGWSWRRRMVRWRDRAEEELSVYKATRRAA